MTISFFSESPDRQAVCRTSEQGNGMEWVKIRTLPKELHEQTIEISFRMMRSDLRG